MKSKKLFYFVICLAPLPSGVSGAPRLSRACFRSPEKRESEKETKTKQNKQEKGLFCRLTELKVILLFTLEGVFSHVNTCIHNGCF